MKHAASSKSPTTAGRAPGVFVGDHVALDLLNTQFLVAGRLTDAWQGDQDVADWLHQAGQPTADAARACLPPDALLTAARTLRDVVRAALERRKRGVRVDARALNGFLGEARSFLQVTPHRDGSAAVERRWSAGSPAQILAPVAEAAAGLLADPAIDLVRQCEAEDCVLWFYDRTKAHRRRWCSPATCGNRHKVAALRERRRTGQPG